MLSHWCWTVHTWKVLGSTVLEVTDRPQEGRSLGLASPTVLLRMQACIHAWRVALKIPSVVFWAPVGVCVGFVFLMGGPCLLSEFMAT